MKKITLIIDLDFLMGPIVKDFVNEKTGELFTGIPVIDNNKKLWELNDEIMTLYSSLYQFDNDGEACSFNQEHAKKVKPQLLILLNKLYDMINKLNDGTFKVENRLDSEFWNIYDNMK